MFSLVLEQFGFLCLGYWSTGVYSVPGVWFVYLCVGITNTDVLASVTVPGRASFSSYSSFSVFSYSFFFHAKYFFMQNIYFCMNFSINLSSLLGSPIIFNFKNGT